MTIKKKSFDPIRKEKTEDGVLLVQQTSWPVRRNRHNGRTRVKNVDFWISKDGGPLLHLIYWCEKLGVTQEAMKERCRCVFSGKRAMASLFRKYKEPQKEIQKMAPLEMVSRPWRLALSLGRVNPSRMPVREAPDTGAIEAMSPVDILEGQSASGLNAPHTEARRTNKDQSSL